MKHLINGLIITVVALVFFACGNDNSLEDLRNNELAKLDKYIQANYPEVEPNPSGLYFIEVKQGTGDTIQQGDRVQYYYAMWTLDSVPVSETTGYIVGQRYEPVSQNVLPPDQLPTTVSYLTDLKGLNEALTYMQKGSVANLVINSAIGVGQNGGLGVPGFTTLLMQVEVYKVYPANP